MDANYFIRKPELRQMVEVTVPPFTTKTCHFLSKGYVYKGNQNTYFNLVLKVLMFLTLHISKTLNSLKVSKSPPNDSVSRTKVLGAYLK